MRFFKTSVETALESARFSWIVICALDASSFEAGTSVCFEDLMIGLDFTMSREPPNRFLRPLLESDVGVNWGQEREVLPICAKTGILVHWPCVKLM